MDDPRVLVIGVGNTLMRDDGIGVWAVRALVGTYDLPPSVRVVDGGVAGLGLLEEICRADAVLIIDAVEGEGPPGSIYRLESEDLPARHGPFFSAHEIGIVEILSTARFMGRLPRTRIVGVKPLETEAMGLDLTPALRHALPQVVAAVVKELCSMGLALKKKESKERTQPRALRS